MAEFLLRGWNVALPEVDVGDDVFVVKDEGGDLFRIQVKTANSKPSRGGYTAQFAVGLSQLKTLRTPDLTYVFVVRDDSGWGPFLIVARENLREEHELYKVGSVSSGKLILRFAYQDADVRCGKRDLSRFRSDWTRWPILRTQGWPVITGMQPLA